MTILDFINSDSRGLSKGLDNEHKNLLERKEKIMDDVQQQISKLKTELRTSGLRDSDIEVTATVFENQLKANIQREVDQIDHQLSEIDAMKKELQAKRESLATVSMKGIQTYFAANR